LERDISTAHDDAMRAAMDILKRLRPKWRKKQSEKGSKRLKLPKSMTLTQKAILQKREYFYTTAEAILAQHKEIQDAVSTDILFEQAIREEIPFELFHDWILAHVSKAKQETLSPKPKPRHLSKETP